MKKFREALAKALYYQYTRGKNWTNDKWEEEPESVHNIYLEMVNQLFTTQEESCRLAIVKEKGELPVPAVAKCYSQRDGYNRGVWEGQRAMLKTYYVQEVKE